MNHNKYIGKKLSEFIKDEYFNEGYYTVLNYGSLSSAMLNDKYLEMTIESIEGPFRDCSYVIKLK